MLAALTQLVRDAFAGAATDVFLVAGQAPRIRHEGEVVELHPGPAAAMALFWEACGIDPASHPEADIFHCRERKSFEAAPKLARKPKSIWT